MKPRERFVTALQCGIPDRVPVFDFLTSQELQKELIGYKTELYDGASQIELAHKLGTDAIFVNIGGYCGFEDEPHEEYSHYKDEWGVTYIKHGYPVMVQTDVPIKNREDWKNYTLPNPQAPHRAHVIRDAVKANEYNIAIMVGFLGPFTMMYWYFMDLENLSLTLYDDPDLITEMCDAYTQWVLESARIAYDAGTIDAFMIADDWGGTSSLLMSPAHLRKLFIKPFGDIVKGLHKYNIPVAMHNDGRIWDVLDDLVNTGINAYHPIEKSAGMDLGTVKKRYKGKLCAIGNVNNKTTMVTGTPEDVRRETLECLEIAAPGGGYILATDHSLHDDIPFENVYALIEVAKKYGKYPLNLKR